MDIVKSDSFFILKKLTSYINKNTSNQKIARLLGMHPFYGGIRALSDSLDKLGIENGVYSLNEEQFDMLEAPFVAHTFMNGGEFIWVDRIQDGSVEILTKEQKHISTNKNTFLSKWSGNVLCFDETKASISNGIELKLKNLAFWFYSNLFSISLVVISVLFLIYSIVTGNNANVFSLQVIKLAGFYVSLGIVYKTYINSDFLKQICKTGKKVDCNFILSSKAAKLFGEISLGELGLVYFASTLIYISFIKNNMNLGAIEYALSAIAFVATFFTLFYQLLYAKKWCVVCLALTSLIWAEFFYMQFAINRIAPEFKLNEILSFVTISAIVVLIFFNIRELILKNLKLSAFADKARTFYTSPEVLNLYMQYAETLYFPAEMGLISNKTANGKHPIALITSLSCPVCAKAYLQLNALLHERQDIEVSIILFAPANNKELNQVAEIIAGVYNTKGWEKANEALAAWYGRKYQNTQKWEKIYGKENGEIGKNMVKEHREWCAEQGIDTFPVLLFKNKKVPANYTLNDIKYLL